MQYGGTTNNQSKSRLEQYRRQSRHLVSLRLSWPFLIFVRPVRVSSHWKATCVLFLASCPHTSSRQYKQREARGGIMAGSSTARPSGVAQKRAGASSAADAVSLEICPRDRASPSGLDYEEAAVCRCGREAQADSHYFTTSARQQTDGHTNVAQLRDFVDDTGHFSLVRNFRLADCVTIMNGVCGSLSVFNCGKYLLTQNRSYLW